LRALLAAALLTLCLVAPVGGAAAHGHPPRPALHYLAGRDGWSRITQYVQCCVTASGWPVFYGEVAADPAIPFGAHVHIPGLGVFVVWDRGGGVRGAHLDVYVPYYPYPGIHDWYRGVYWW